MTTLVRLAALLLFSFSLYANDVIYTWVDDKGVRHYSQLPPEGEVEVTRLSNADLEPQRIGSVAPVRKDDQPATNDPLQQQADTIKAKNAAQAEDICNNAKHNLNVLLSHAQISKPGEKEGEMVMMSDEDKQAAIKENQQRVKLFCEQ
ncbi:DUF4124 domain-containing protein [Shewanella sp. GXUN23E]|uniref:DUF4124 domain-containing protein n=1 Tax=Shewanella sp. GXUN23E TaxID=3422498 RepID=UPI003D7E0C80